MDIDPANKVRVKTTNPAVQPSNHSKVEPTYKSFPKDATNAYTRQHQTTGLDTPYQGPFRIADRPSRSTAKVEVGVYKSGEKRFEVRHVNDLKAAHPDSFAAPFHRPQLGRPAKTSANASGPAQTDQSPQQTRSSTTGREAKEVNKPAPSTDAEEADAETSKAGNSKSSPVIPSDLYDNLSPDVTNHFAPQDDPRPSGPVPGS